MSGAEAIASLPTAGIDPGAGSARTDVPSHRWLHGGLGPDDGVFPDALRRAALLWLAVTVPLVVGAGAFIHGERAYVIAWVLTAGLYTTPALVVTALLTSRAAVVDRPFWRQWFVALVAVYGVGALLLGYAVVGATPPRVLATIAVVVPIAGYATALYTMARSREGGRRTLVDVIEVVLVVVLVGAPLPLVFGERILAAEETWLATPAAVCAVMLTGATVATLHLLGRICDHRVAEVLGVALAAGASLNAALQVAQALSGFTLPSGLLLGVQALNMGLLLLLPLYVRTVVPVGLDRLAPEAQVRKASTSLAVLTFTLVPLLGVVTAMAADETGWAATYSAAALGVLIVLSTVRHLLTVDETKGLYVRMERAADERRVLLAEVMRSIEDDRRHVAGELHEQAVSSYAAFVAYLQATGRVAVSRPAAGGDDLATASALVRALRATGRDAPPNDARRAPARAGRAPRQPGRPDPRLRREPLRRRTVSHAHARDR